MALRPPDSSKPITPPDGSGVTLERSFLRFTDFVSAYAPQVSLGGMFVPSVAPPPPGTIVDLDFKLDDGYRLFQGVGEVVWVQVKGNQGAHTPGAGVRFHALDERGRELILKVLEDHVAVGGTPFELEPPPLGASRELDAVTLPAVSPTGDDADDDLISAPALQDDPPTRRAPAAVTEASVEAEIDAAVGELDLQSIASPSQHAIVAEGPSTEVAAATEEAAEEAPELDTAPAPVVDSGMAPVVDSGKVSEAANGETVEAAAADEVESKLEWVEMTLDREIEVAETAPDLEIDLVAIESSDEIASVDLPDPPAISDADLPDPPLTLKPLAVESVDRGFLPAEKALVEAPRELFPGVEVAGSEAVGELSVDLDLPAGVLPEVELLDQAPPAVDLLGERFSDETPSLEDVLSAKEAAPMASEASFASLIADEADRSAPTTEIASPSQTVQLEIPPPVETGPDDRGGAPAAIQALGGHSLPPMDAIDRAVLEPVDVDPSEATHPGVAEAAPVSVLPDLSTSELDSVPRPAESATPSRQPVKELGPAHQTTVDLSAFTPTPAGSPPAVSPPEISIPEMPPLAPPPAAPDSAAVTPEPAAVPVALSEDAALSEEPVFDRAQYFEASRPKRRWPVWVLAAAATAALAFFGYSWFNGSRTIGSGLGVVVDPVSAQGDARVETAGEPDVGLESDSAIELTAHEVPEQRAGSLASEAGLDDSASGPEPRPSLATPSLATSGAPATGTPATGTPAIGTPVTGDRETGSVARISGAPAEGIREILWRETVDSTVVTLVGDGRLSPDRLRVLAMGGESPRVLLRIARVSLPYHSSRQAIDGRHVRAIRTGLHPETQELHIVLDLAADDVRLLADPVADADNRIRLTLGR